MIDLHTGDCRDVLKRFNACSFDACVTDPPYELSFMGRQWDRSGVANDPSTWREVFRVLKPGAHLLAFGGTRTYHRMTCAIEDAGFEIRDCLMWVYGSGFPKSLDVSKAIDKGAGAEREIVGRKGGRYDYGFTPESAAPLGRNAPRPNAAENMERAAHITAPTTDSARRWQGWGTALKPALEPIVLARKPLDGTVAENVCRHGTGALDIDGCRVGMLNGESVRTTQGGKDGGGFDVGSSDATRSTAFESHKLGRWPANLIHDGSEEVVALFPQTESGAPGIKRGGNTGPAFGKESRPPGTPMDGFGDAGSAARFFYTAKVSPSERGRDNTHPTVKPLDLMRYLCKLVTPPGGTILDPFAGSGSTAIAAAQLDMNAVCIDLEAEHVEIQANRIRDELGMFIELRRHEAA